MLTLSFTTLGILITSLVLPITFIWPRLLILTSSLPLLATTIVLPNHFSTIWHSFSFSLGVDSISAPLILLTVWLLPLTLLARRPHLKTEPPLQQRIYSALLITLTLILIVTFSALDFILFYIAFETTLIPTLIIITRWGHQLERLQAGMYFIFYTLFGSFPLLLSLLALTSLADSSNIALFSLTSPLSVISSTNTITIWWFASILAFLAKLPIYGLHLWLPKAHVEAPIAGSMILAAILLKLGGYGLIRVLTLFNLPSSNLEFIVTFCVWGSLVTSLICLRQSDMKALIAYSSVGHMRLVAAGVFSQTSWGLRGALILMIAHGLISSALFCLANLSYERTLTRTLALNRGLKLITPLASLWWLAASASNLALPPSPNFLGEFFIITNLISWNPWTSLPLGLTALFTAVYSLYLFQSSQHTQDPRVIKKAVPTQQIEHLNLFLHLAPLILLAVKPEFIILTA